MDWQTYISPFFPNPLSPGLQPTFPSHCPPPIMTSSSTSSSSSGGSTTASNAITALGTLIGYLGTEVKIEDQFSRLLWPQRAYANFSARNAWKLALFMPMGGPLHRVSLQVLDTLFRRGMFRGAHQGHMLGTAFFADTGAEYTVFETGRDSEREFVRNGIWVRAVRELPALEGTKVVGKGAEEVEAGQPLVKKVRQRTSVAHVRLEQGRREGGEEDKCIPADTDPAGFKVFAAIVTTEASAVLTFVLVAALSRSAFALLWLPPLLLKLLGALFTMQREPLATPPSAASADHSSKLYEVANVSGTGFLLVEGPDSAVFQFFRHYGHPVRSRAREIFAMSLVGAFAALFPIGLTCSILWMPPTLQYVWLAYQLYATVAMHVYHYSGGHSWASMEERIAEVWAKKERAGDECEVIFGKGKESVRATLERAPCESAGEGRKLVARAVEHFMGRDKGDSNSKSCEGSGDGDTRSSSPSSAGSQTPMLEPRTSKSSKT